MSTPQGTNAAPAPRPTAVRYGVLALACALAMITYLDRACLGSAKGWFVHDLGLRDVTALWLVFPAFNLAYALFEIPSGWLGDVFGPRRVLVRIVVWWSLCVALTGLVGLKIGSWTLGGVGHLVAVQFLFGMGEAGAFPNIARALYNWFPFRDRGFTQGMVWMSGRLMGGLTPLVVAQLIPPATEANFSTVGPWRWRMVFWMFAAVGGVWCTAFALWFRNRPGEHPQVNAAEAALIAEGRAARPATHDAVPWGKLLASRSLWLLGMMYFCQSFAWYFYMTYFPGYMHQRYGVAKGSPLWALSEGGPLWVGAIGCVIGGLATDWYIRRTGDRRRGRKIFGILGHGITSLCFLLCPWMPGPLSFFLVISASGFFTDLTMGSSWAACQDIGRRYAGIAAGCMNTVGNLGGAAGTWTMGMVLRHFAGSGPDPQPADLLTGYNVNFYLFAAVFFVGTLCWIGIDATQAVAED